ncbi:MAG: CehA/McbA family metallohydrolase [Isosphaeraceae bacterium]
MSRQLSRKPALVFSWVAAALVVSRALAATPRLDVVPVEGQPLAANVERLVRSLDSLGHPLPAALVESLSHAIESRDASELQRQLDPHVLLTVSINPEERVKVDRGPAEARIQQAGYTPVIVKVVNEAGTTRPLRISSPQSGPRMAGSTDLSTIRQDQRELKRGEVRGGAPGRFLQVEMFTNQPMTDRLGGLRVEYAIALIHSIESGQREATLGFDVGQGTQDLGFRGETAVLFTIRPAIPVRFRVLDQNGEPTIASFTLVDRAGQVHPPQPKRLAPDLFFQKQIYRADGEVVLLPPGVLRVSYSRGPEYRVKSTELIVPENGEGQFEARLERWIDPASHGYFSGDHHIHAAGCAHYTEPTQGVSPADMFRQVKGEGLNVGCVLTWGPCYDYQRRFFEPRPDTLSERNTVLKYDVEVSGFGSQALGHVCLINLKDQSYPGSDGTATKGWPTWTTPVLRWAKAQGGITGYAHSASGLEVNAKAATSRMLTAHDSNQDGTLTADEASQALLPEPLSRADTDHDGSLTRAELETSHERATDTLPNLAIPEMSGVGAMEVVVSVPEGACDFISAMDTPRIAEWNMWYHLLNCGFPLKISGETDFPCMSGLRVGQGRVYVRLGDVKRVDFDAWCAGLAAGRSYVSDGFAHAFDFQVDGHRSGDRLQLDRPGSVRVEARVAFAEQNPRSVAHGAIVPPGGRRLVGDTVNLHGPRRDGEYTQPGEPRRVEIVVNGEVVAHRDVPADGAVHKLEFSVPMERSSWIALREFPQLHTNPVEVVVKGHPIRASRRSALWCLNATEQLWRSRARMISASERDEAERAFERTKATYRKIAAEAPLDR